MPTLQELQAQAEEQRKAGLKAKKDMATAMLPALEELQSVLESPEAEALLDRMTAIREKFEGVQSNAADITRNVVTHFKSAQDTVAAEIQLRQQESNTVIR